MRYEKYEIKFYYIFIAWVNFTIRETINFIMQISKLVARLRITKDDLPVISINTQSVKSVFARIFALSFSGNETGLVT